MVQIQSIVSLMTLTGLVLVQGSWIRPTTTTPATTTTARGTGTLLGQRTNFPLATEAMQIIRGGSTGKKHTGDCRLFCVYYVRLNPLSAVHVEFFCCNVWLSAPRSAITHVPATQPHSFAFRANCVIMIDKHHINTIRRPHTHSRRRRRTQEKENQILQPSQQHQ